ncbi:bifunctional ADP-dependent NAD(P)H-hydrate dehydratase/NAD(P)H-hydrate epimerase [Rudaea cellulosilytica]|uniref:bifunctional ADP-dependent NAD(P)H-hydrate dehydratase/NAD(P)H-hydrate epimerase n=1 Tax=Rudaea cellulosilytica TaxID=540746 RepID=UPI0003817F44|nr:bifunctional ADP-dependent NAD(P)H-hydrate dehydratase/NAD(P)H-hydrate epimerase [Rudaea cellulosilytica]
MNGHPLHTIAQVRTLERMAIDALRIPGDELMRRAGAAAWDQLRLRWPGARRIAVLCGVGNNGGDGYVVARLARDEGLDAVVIALGSPREGSEAARAHADWCARGGAALPPDGQWPQADVYVDALFGIGLARAADGAARNLIEKLNAVAAPVLALDVPSGLDADTGFASGPVVRATMTVTFIADKRGLHTGVAADVAGDVVVDSLGLPKEIHANESCDTCLLDTAMIAAVLPPRARDGHKGRYGHVLAVGGDHGMGGAIRLAGETALRTGAGLVSVATRAEHVTAINAARPELMVHAVSGIQELQPLLERASVVALGPGLGRRAWGHALWHAAIAAGKPLVLDADGLNLLANDGVALPAQAVLTPHPGEAARLLGVDIEAIARDRFAAARELARRHHAVVVLKGAGTLIANPGGDIAVCPWGNPGMATGGMGDALTGVIASLLAQGFDAWGAAWTGVALHARAGDVAARDGEAGLIASDLLGPLRRLRNNFAAA